VGIGAERGSVLSRYQQKDYMYIKGNKHTAISSPMLIKMQNANAINKLVAIYANYDTYDEKTLEHTNSTNSTLELL
jgi:hypothetical protein